MAELIYDAQQLAPGEPFYRLRIGLNPSTNAILGDVDMDLTAPAIGDDLAPTAFSGFEWPAREALALAQARAAENGIAKILVVDPLGLLSLAPAGRYRR